MPPSVGKKKRGKPKQKSRTTQQAPDHSAFATSIESTDNYTAADAERYGREFTFYSFSKIHIYLGFEIILYSSNMEGAYNLIFFDSFSTHVQGLNEYY